MRIIHTADLHLGVKFKNVTPRPKYDRYEQIDLKSFVNRITLENLSYAVEYAIDKNADLFIIAGDIFETIESSLEYHIDLINVLKPLIESDIRTVIIGGNHDYIRSPRRRISLALLEDLKYPNIIFKSSVDIKSDFNRDSPYYINIGGEKVGLILLPYFWTMKSEFQKYVRKYIRKMLEKLESVEYLILVAHIDVTGARYHEDDFIGSFRSIEKVPLHYIHPEKFDYIALGHIHFPQKISEGHIWYSGSLNKLNFGEYKDEKAFLDIEIGRRVRVDKIKVDPVKMKVYKLRMDDIELIWSNIRRRLETVLEDSDPINSIIKIVFKTRTSGDYRKLINSYGDKIKEFLWSYGVAGVYIKPDVIGVSARESRDLETMMTNIALREALKDYIQQLPYDNNLKQMLLDKALKYMGVSYE